MTTKEQQDEKAGRIEAAAGRRKGRNRNGRCNTKRRRFGKDECPEPTCKKPDVPNKCRDGRIYPRAHMNLTTKKLCDGIDKDMGPWRQPPPTEANRKKAA